MHIRRIPGRGKRQLFIEIGRLLEAGVGNFQVYDDRGGSGEFVIVLPGAYKRRGYKEESGSLWSW